jgi:hypothetical protein
VRCTVRVLASWLVACFALLATSVPAAGAPKPISGKLTRPGYTVAALAADGHARVVRTSRGKFRLRPSARRVTLHLRAPDGVYAGPIVVLRRKKGRRAVLGVRAGARLGKIRVGRGYAKVTKRLRRKWVDASRVARARKGVPIGARNFGRVRSRPPRRSIRGDADLDGVPNPLDIDDDGDLILDNLDRSRGVRAAQALIEPLVTSGLTLDAAQTVNANPRHSTDPTRPAFTDQQIDEALSGPGAGLEFAIPSRGSTELDCEGDPTLTPPRLGLSYCASGGTGIATGGEFPECCDPDEDGFGTLPGLDRPRGLTHGAVARPGPGQPPLPPGTSQIGTGDELFQHVTLAGDESQCPPPPLTSNPNCDSSLTILQYVFTTVPALVSYDDDGPAGEPPTTLPYPNQVGGGGEFPVSAPPGQDVVVRLTFWRPQRRRIANDPELEAGDSATWTDISGLNYTANGSVAVTPGVPGPPPNPPGVCPQSAFSDPSSEPTPNKLTPLPGPLHAGGFKDEPGDEPANVANKLSYTLNLTQCVGSPWTVGELRRFHFVVTSPNGGGVAQQIVQFRRQ